MRAACVSILITRIFTSGMAALEESVTVPEILPVLVCASVVDVQVAARKATKQCTIKDLVVMFHTYYNAMLGQATACPANM
jgi:hypothetical protein